MNDILNLFYNILIKEAAEGRIDCFFQYNVIFNTKIIEDGIEVLAEKEETDLFVPTLLIKNKAEFEKLLLEYVQKFLNFYDDNDFYEEVRESNFRDNEKGISKEKLSMILLWSNATVSDFNDPCSYLRKRIQFFELGSLEKFLVPKEVGYSEVLDANVEVSIVKNRFENETPYSFQIFLKNPVSGERIYELPRVYMGISDNIGYVYAILNRKDHFENSEYFKGINRKMYKVNEGMDVAHDNYDNYGFGNLKDITPSFLLVANVVMGIFREENICRVSVPSILISRWNAKILSLSYRKNLFSKSGKSIEEIEQLEKDFYENIFKIQSNLTEKFLRIFRRLGYHHSTIGIESYPMEVSDDLCVRIYEGEDVCNNSLLGETYSFDYVQNRLKR